MLYSIALPKEDKIRIAIVDIIAIAAVFLVPALAHKFSIPLYLAEPLRLMIILSITHTRKGNAYILALTLPLFSYIVSGHPVFYKMLAISGELALNVYLFYRLIELFPNKIFSGALSIIISKAFYYSSVMALILANLMTNEDAGHPILPQIIMGIVFIAYLQLFYKREENPKGLK
ncbi:MAG: hypothetical protein HW421_2169 [Ignavibacteria bacterium]|nr:hypothetical protein [Ignavibacteria bacterium]